jgi:hypothetical protein
MTKKHQRVFQMTTDVLVGFVPGIPRSGQTVRMARGRVLSWQAAGNVSKAWRVRLVAAFGLAVEQAGGVGAVRGLVGEGGIGLGLVFTFKAKDPARFGEAHTARPDADNLCKVVLDVAKAAGLYGGRDDAAVSALEPVKVWGPVAGLAWAVRRLEPRQGARTGGVLVAGVDAEAPEWLG